MLKFQSIVKRLLTFLCPRMVKPSSCIVKYLGIPFSIVSSRRRWWRYIVA